MARRKRKTRNALTPLTDEELRKALRPQPARRKRFASLKSCITRVCAPGSATPRTSFCPPPTLLGSAFAAGDVDAARILFDEIVATDTPKWKLETTLPDLELSLQHVTDANGQAALRAIAEQLKQLI